MTVWLLTYGLHSTALLSAALVLDRWVRSDPRSRSLLWRTAALAGIMTASFAVATSGPAHIAFSANVVQSVWVDADGTATFRTLSGSERPVRTRIVQADAVCSTALREQALDVRAVIDEVRSACPVPTDWREVLTVLLLGLWALGAIGLSARLVADARAGRRLAEGLQPAEGRTRRIFDSIAPGRGSTVWTSDDVPAPCVVPGRRVIVPAWCAEEMSDAELRGVLGHELGHVVRRDLVWSHVLRCLTSLLWFQPLNHLARSRARQASELACDDWAVARTGDGYGLAASIARVAESITPGVWVPDVAMVGTGRRPLEERVRRILSPPPSTGRPAWLGPVLALLIVAPAWLLPAVRPPERMRAVFAVERGITVPDSIALHTRGLDPSFDGRLVGEAERIVIRAIESD